MNQQLLEKIVTLAAKDPDRCQWRTKDDTVVTKFHELFPLESLPKLTLEQYCLGHYCQPDNFSWWLERGMIKQHLFCKSRFDWACHVASMFR